MVCTYIQCHIVVTFLLYMMAVGRSWFIKYMRVTCAATVCRHDWDWEASWIVLLYIFSSRFAEGFKDIQDIWSSVLSRGCLLPFGTLQLCSFMPQKLDGTESELRLWQVEVWDGLVLWTLWLELAAQAMSVGTLLFTLGSRLRVLMGLMELKSSLPGIFVFGTNDPHMSSCIHRQIN